MSWAVIRHAGRAVLHRPLPGVLGRGTLLLEITLAAQHAPLTLLDGCGWHIGLRADGIVDLEGSFGGTSLGESLPLRLPDRPEPIRLSLSWADGGGVLFTLYQPTCGTLRQAHVPGVSGRGGGVDPGALLAALEGASRGVGALSTGWEPIGPMPTLRDAGKMLTARGARDVASLAAGDVLGCQIGPAQEVLGVGAAILPAFGSFRPIRIRAPWFGLKRDVLLSAEALVMLSGDDLEYLCGTPSALVRADHLVNGTSVAWEPCGPLIRYAQPICAQVAVPAGTLGVATLDLGPTLAAPLARASSLAAPLARLPERGDTGLPILRDYEALTLAEMRAA
ncbi:MAG: Hint domain-containing protein [Shimia sp.]